MTVIMKKTKIELDLETFPKRLWPFFQSAEVYDSSSDPSARVYYLDTGYYVKVAPSQYLAREAEMDRLFHAIGMGVEVVAYLSEEQDYLVTRSAAGEDLVHLLCEPEKLCDILASALRRLHCQPICNAPVSTRHQRYMDSANGDYNGGFYDESVLMARYPIGSKEEAWKIMQENKHLLTADTLIHGDACLPNLVQSGGTFSAFIDCNMAGVGDKHIDLYWAMWSLQYNLKTDAYTDLFMQRYGKEHINEEKLRIIAAFELFG